MAELITLAQVVGVHGIKGWVKIRPFLEDLDILTSLARIQLVPGEKVRIGSTKTVKIDAVKQQGKGVIAHVEGIDDRSAAEEVRGFLFQTEQDNLPPAELDEIYWRDLVGMQVFCCEPDSDDKGVVVLGQVDYLLDTGANDVLVVKATDDSVDDRERLIPWLVDSVVTKIDTESRSVWVSWYVDA
ncbi:MAG: 16S rRNA processing protein RimM [Luminiphilus sp.]|nr:16S rRNA processing protein RimM [Luminiphilus sp.]MDA0630935.1 ribosome maturation factor RimM [Pseudomonadota bacterium]